MSFLSPFLLAGAAAVGLPIALHFLFKAWYRPLPWAAMEFLRKSMEQTARRIKFRELILLLLRCLLLVLLAVALARPVLNWAGATGRGESVDAVLLIDTSLGMGARDGESTRLDRAKEAALGVIDNLPPGSTVQVVTCSDRAAAVPFTPSNLDQARNVVKAVALTAQAGDILPGLSEAHAALDRELGANKEVYVFSALQKSGWEPQAGAVKAKAAEIKQRAAFVLVRCGNPDRPIANVAVTDITYPDSIPHANTRLPFTVLLKNTGTVPVRNVAVTLEVDGSPQDVDTGLAAEIPAGATVPVTLTGKFGEAGPRLLSARIGRPKEEGGVAVATAQQPDDLPGDNRFDKLVPVRDKLKVLIVDGAPDLRDPTRSASHFIAAALRVQIPPDPERPTEPFVTVDVIRASATANATLSDYQLCVLANVPASADDKPGIPPLAPEFADRLEQFVKDGGGLVVGCGDFVVPDSYDDLFGKRGLLPVKLTGVVRAKPETPFKPAADTVEAPGFLSKFKGEPFATVTGDVDVFATVTADEAAGFGGRVVMRLDSQAPLVSAKSLGAGEVVFVHTALDSKQDETSWSNWAAKTPAYLSFVRFVVAHLTGRGVAGSNRVAGEPLTFRPATDGGQYDLVKPDKTRVRISTPTRDPDGRPLVSVADTPVAGEYRIVGGELKDADAPRFAVNPDLRGSADLELLTDPQVQDKIGFAPVIVAAGTEADAVGRVRGSRELTIALLLAAFVVGCVEVWWAWRCGRAI